MTRCEGFRRHGGAFSFGPVTWSQCPEEAIVILFVRQDGKKRAKPIPSCMKCWQEAMVTKAIVVTKADPIEKGE